MITKHSGGILWESTVSSIHRWYCHIAINDIPRPYVHVIHSDRFVFIFDQANILDIETILVKALGKKPPILWGLRQRESCEVWQYPVATMIGRQYKIWTFRKKKFEKYNSLIDWNKALTFKAEGASASVTLNKQMDGKTKEEEREQRHIAKFF